MEEQGHLVIIIAPLNSPLYLKAREKGITVHPLSFQTLAQVGEYGRIRQIFANEKPFVVNCHGRADARIALKAAQKTGVPCRIITRHTGGALKNTWANRKIYKTLSHYVFTTANDTTRHLRDLFNLSEMEIFSIPDGISEPDGLPENDDARKNLAHDFGLPVDTRFIGILGKVPEPKALAALFKAVKLSPRAASRHLVFFEKAENKNKERMAQLASELGMAGKIHHAPGTEEDCWALYRALDCLLFPEPPAVYPGVPLGMLEALYAGCPVIGADCGGIRDIIAHEKTGLLFTPGHDSELAKMTEAALADETSAQKRAAVAREVAKNKYTMDAMGRDLIRIYRLRQVKIERRLHYN
ncbi:MAG: glycosyltransferase [Desulfobacter sp.]|nr:MAG: glycosyltransferase [Desulfobacter sp.]